VYELERRVSYAVDQMERNGFGIDEERLQAFIERTTEEAERLKAELEAEWDINPGSSKQLREHFGLDGRKGWPTTPSGAPSTNQEAMQGLLNTVPSIAKWLEWKRVEKLRSTYGLSLQKRVVDGRIHARFNPFGTATGRFSSSGPNLQNIPKDERLRSLFWSGGDDRRLVKADYASIELWVAAVRWEDPYMQKALQQGVNMHVATAAAALFNVSSRGRSLRSKIRRRITSAFPA
jgi:DNA polymerase I